MNRSKKCILISLDNNVSELKDLANSLEFVVVKIFIQQRDNPNPKYFIGKGKLTEINDYIKENDIDTVIINSSLKPSQQYNLENFLGITVYDRIRLILEIFADRAHSEEAKLQVELAKFQYEIPLLRDWIHKARYGEKPGFMAGGEYEVAQYYEISRRRIKKIKGRLKNIEKERDLHRKHRKKSGYFLVSIVGYTNAGKSTIFKMISGEEVKIEDRLFTTLSTTTRSIRKINRPILITDTVGLIDNLPHWIIESFHSTLEEIFLADVILFIIDISESTSEINRKFKTGFDVLLPDLNPAKIILIFNKIDRLDNYNEFDTSNEEELNIVIDKIKDNIKLEHDVGAIVSVSALDNTYKGRIIQAILDTTEYPIELTLTIPNIPDSQGFINWLHENVEIISIEYQENVTIILKCRERDKGYITKTYKKLKGKI
ncbi:MAG: GTPase HflX [Candidatus Hodarchaeales archaeon]|jgi:GTP-binding protein HflX